jgi:CDP-diglyceride synthetase
MNSFPQLKTRLATAGLLIVGALILILAAHFFEPLRWISPAIVFAITAGAIIEYALLCLKDGDSPIAVLNNSLISSLPAISVFIAGMGLRWSPIAVAASAGLASCFVIGIFVFVRLRDTLDKPLQSILEPWVMYQLLGVGGASFVAISFDPLTLLWLLLCVCFNDAAAYFVGIKYQGPKLAPGVSPAKTFSGALGGLGAGAIAGILASPLLRCFCLFELLILSLLVVITAQLGDLLKSILKRFRDVKDSSTLLPGHGGVLDRIDGVLLASIVLVAWKILT